MSRLARKDLQTQFLHVMVQGINKEFIFNKHDYIQTYLKTINQYEKEFPITIIAYCIMNNHAHLLIHVEEIKFLSKFMHIVNLLYSQFYNKENNRCGVIFRNKYKIEPIYDLSHLINCINYIHLNPVKANIVDNCSKYPYSSYIDYSTNTGICQSEIMHDLFGKSFDFSALLRSNDNNIFMDITSPTFIELQIQIDKRIK